MVSLLDECIPKRRKEKMNDVRHLYLYAKGHYQRTDITKDLKVIVGKLTMMYPEHVDIGNILFWLTKEVYKYITDYDDFFNFISAYFPENKYLYEDINQDSYYILIRKCLSILSLTSVDEIGYDIGVADREILPLTSDVLLDCNGLKCSVCDKSQYNTPSGATCKNSHGGSDGY